MLRKKIQKSFKFCGRVIRPDAVFGLEEVLRQQQDPDTVLELVLRTIKTKVGANTVIDAAIVSEVLKELSNNQQGQEEAQIDVVGAFDMPKFVLHKAKQQFVKMEKGRPVDKANYACLYRERVEIVRQRLMRHRNFAPSIVGGAASTVSSSSQLSKRVRGGAGAQNSRVELTTVDSLIASSSLPNTVFVLGLLSRLSDGHLYLEDVNGRIQVEIGPQTVFDSGLITEGCIVLVEGSMRDDVLCIDFIRSPPPETREDSINVLGELDFLKDTDHVLSAEAKREQFQMEKNAEDASFVFLSDVHLDENVIQRKLEVMFAAFAQMEPAPGLFVFMGNFSSRPFGEGEGQCSGKAYAGLMAWLGGLIIRYPGLLLHSKFVFIPGPQDPGDAGLLPRASIPNFFAKHMKRKMETEIRHLESTRPDQFTALSEAIVNNVQFQTNPCRIRYYTQEIVLFREDMISKLHRNCIKEPYADENDEASFSIPKHFCHTIVEQGHLCSLPLHIRPILWAHDHTLRLYPLPTVVVIGDKYDQFVFKHGGCQVVNPGAFSLDCSFVLYRPSDQEVEFSKVDGDNDPDSEMEDDDE